MVCRTHRKAVAPRRASLNQRTEGCNNDLHQQPQQRSETLRLAQNRRPDPRLHCPLLYKNFRDRTLGRNMFGPVRGPWEGDSWKGWWGDSPPYHTPVFVLTHYARPPLIMEGGTTFHFVSDGPEAALMRAREAAQGKDVRIGGGVSVIR